MFKEKIDPNASFDHFNRCPSERLLLYCTPIPGETKWTSNSNEEVSLTESDDLVLISTQRKRKREEEPQNSDYEGIENHKKKMSNNDEYNAESSYLHVRDFNYPLKNMEGLPAIVKVYGDMNGEQFRLNDVFEFTGFFYFNDEVLEVESSDFDGSWVSHASGIPILHCIAHKKLSDINPHIPLSPVPFNTMLNNFQELIPHVRQKLISLFNSCIGYDSLASEYLLFNILSRVYYRQNTITPIGNLPVNFIVGENSSGFSASIHSLLNNITTRCHQIVLTLDNLNKANYVPYKDYTQERLISGELQLSAGTHLIIDETQLQTGELSEKSLSQMNALDQLVNQQIVSYDFQYHTMDVLTDIPVIIVSKGRSIFKGSHQVPVKARKSYTLFDSNNEILEKDTSNLITTIRTYIGLVRNISMQPSSEEVHKFLQDDFVNIRQSNENLSPELFGHWLNLSKLVCLSFGDNILDRNRWEYTKNLEYERLSRLG